MTTPPISPRKSPRQARSTATVEAVLEAATRILDERGLEAFNTNAVAALAGVSVGSLYQYFPGKDAITATLIRRDHETLLAALVRAEAATRHATLAQGLWAFAEVAVDHQFGRPRLARLLDVEEARLPVAEDSRAALRAIRALVEGFLARRLPGLAPADRAEAAGDLLALARGLIDAAAEDPATAPANVTRRVAWALAGYLDRRTAALG